MSSSRAATSPWRLKRSSSQASEGVAGAGGEATGAIGVLPRRVRRPARASGRTALLVRTLTRYLSAMSSGPGSSRRLIRVLEADPDLGQALDGPDLAEATRQAVGTLETAEPGPWRPLGVHDGELLYGGLICDG